MTTASDKRRSRGDGTLYYDEGRARWVATVIFGYDGRGKRVKRKATGRTKTEARDKLRAMLQDQRDAVRIDAGNYTVRQAMADWLAYGLPVQDESTRETLRIISETHVVPHLGAYKLNDLRPEHVDRWLAGIAAEHSTSTVRRAHACLNRAVKFALVRDKARRNIVELCRPPRGERDGHPRPSRRSRPTMS